MSTTKSDYVLNTRAVGVIVCEHCKKNPSKFIHKKIKTCSDWLDNPKLEKTVCVKCYKKLV